MKKLTIIFCAALLCSCAKERTPRYDLALSLDSIAMHYDQTDTLAVVHVVAETATLNFVFASSDTNVVKVDDGGVVSGVSVGNATVTATATNGTAEAKCEVTIVPYSNMYVEPPFKWNMTYNEAKALIAPEDLLNDMGNGKDLYARWIPPVDSIRYNFSGGVFSGTSLYIDLSTNFLFNEAVLFVKERCGTDCEVRQGYGTNCSFQNRHDSKCEIHVCRYGGGLISLVYAVKW